jgi:hypothetical protein
MEVQRPSLSPLSATDWGVRVHILTPELTGHYSHAVGWLVVVVGCCWHITALQAVAKPQAESLGLSHPFLREQ